MSRSSATASVPSKDRLPFFVFLTPVVAGPLTELRHDVARTGSKTLLVSSVHRGSLHRGSLHLGMALRGWDRKRTVEEGTMRQPLLSGFFALALLLVAAPSFAGFASSGPWDAELSSRPADRPADPIKMQRDWNASEDSHNMRFETEKDGGFGKDSWASPRTPSVFTTRTPLIQMHEDVNDRPSWDSKSTKWGSPTVGNGDFRHEFDPCRPAECTKDGCDRKDTSGCDTRDKHDGCGSVTCHGKCLGDCCPPRSCGGGGCGPGGCGHDPGGCGPKPGGGSPSAVPEPASVVVWSLLAAAAAFGHCVRRRRISA
jgi:hypothetical protein